MSFTPHLLVQRARVGSAALRRHEVRLLDGEPALALALALAPPRLWGYLLDATLDGFADGYVRPHDGKTSTRVHQGLRVAQATLRARIDGLLDHRGADVALLALACEGPVVHALVTGSLSAYVCRRQGLRRIGARDAPDEGVLKAEPVWCAEHVEPGDLVFAGPSALFAESTLSRVRTACLNDRRIDPQEVASLLTSSDAPQGAALAVFRVS